MTTSKTQDEMETPAKVYQVDAVSKQIEELANLVKSMTATNVTTQTLELAIKDAKDASDKATKLAIEESKTNWVKAGWLIFGTLLYLVGNNIWQVVGTIGRVVK
jgi:hypothetical protein